MKLAWKELTHSWKKYALISVIVILMMFMVLFLSGLVDGLGRAVSAGVEQMDAQAFVLKEDSEGLITISSVTEEEYEQIKEQADGEVATIDIQRLYLSKEGSDEKIDVTYFAVDPEGILAPDVYEGVTLQDSDAKNPIVLDDMYEAEGIKVGDTIRDASSEVEFTVAGFSRDKMYGHTSVGYVSVDTYTQIMSALSSDYVKHYHAVALEKGVQDLNIEGLQVVPKAEIIDSLPGYKSEQMTIKMVDWMLLIITSAILAIFFFVINLQKEKEFGVMKAIGIGMGRLTGFVLWEVGLVAAFGAIVAGVLVWAMAQGLPGTMPFYLQTANVLAILAAFVGISLVGSLLSIVKVARIDPADIIGGDN